MPKSKTIPAGPAIPHIIPKKFKFDLRYSEKYKKGAAVVRHDCLPKVKHLPFIDSDTGGEIIRTEILEAGVGKVDGKRVEFQVVKFYMDTP